MNKENIKIEKFLELRDQGGLELKEVTQKNGENIILCPSLIVAIYQSNDVSWGEYITGEKYKVENSPENIYECLKNN